MIASLNLAKRNHFDQCQVQILVVGQMPPFLYNLWGQFHFTTGGNALSQIKGINSYLYCILAHQTACWPPESLSSTSTGYTFLSLLCHPGPSHPTPYPKLFQLVGFPPVICLALRCLYSNVNLGLQNCLYQCLHLASGNLLSWFWLACSQWLGRTHWGWTLGFQGLGQKERRGEGDAPGEESMKEKRDHAWEERRTGKHNSRVKELGKCGPTGSRTAKVEYRI